MKEHKTKTSWKYEVIKFHKYTPTNIHTANKSAKAKIKSVRAKHTDQNIQEFKSE